MACPTRGPIKMLEVRQLTKLYTGIAAVDHVSFAIQPGEILGYLGPNGAGKSTTVKMLIGLLEPTSGHIEFHGRDIRQDLKAYQRQVGYVPEEPHLYPHLSGREYLQLAGRLRGMPRRQLEPKMDELLRLIGLWDDRHAELASYSKGMRQKILLMAALLHDPELLILDEPFSGLDVLVREELIESILDRTPEATVLVCSHDLGEIESFATHVAYLNEGRLEFAEEMATLTERFREVEVTLEGEAELPRELPSHWMNAECAGVVARFTDARYDEAACAAEVARRFGAVRGVEVRGVEARRMSFRAIFLAMARAARRAQ